MFPILSYCINSLNTRQNHYRLTAWMELYPLTWKILSNLILGGLIGDTIHQGVFVFCSKLQKLHFVLKHEAISSSCLGWLSSDQLPRFYFFLFCTGFFPLEKHFPLPGLSPESHSLGSSWFWHKSLFIAHSIWSVLQACFIFIKLWLFFVWNKYLENTVYM